MNTISSLFKWIGNTIGADPSTMTTTNKTVVGAINEVDARPYIVESGTSGIWTYRKWSDGTAECWGTQSLGIKAITTVYGYGYYASAADTINFPSNLFTGTPDIQATARDVAGYGTWFNAIINGTSKTAVKGYVWSSTSVSTEINVSIQAIGRWK